VKCAGKERVAMKRQAEKIRREEKKQAENEKKTRARANKKRKTYVIKLKAPRLFIQALTIFSILLSSPP
jgi:hypothetical protein